ncbi:MAG: hypothetical protein HUU23_07925 [Caldilineales bacterium]|nr:hypothetical protein [Caldilineales bacterium]
MTKSIRLTPQEAQELATVSQQSAASEAALMKKWLLQGLQEEKVDRAIQAYMQRKTDLRGGAALAGVSYNRFWHEVQKRNIVVLDEEGFEERLYELADMFDDETLKAALASQTITRT